jgi:hypothetical protein
MRGESVNTAQLIRAAESAIPVGRSSKVISEATTLRLKAVVGKNLVVRIRLQHVHVVP